MQVKNHTSIIALEVPRNDTSPFSRPCTFPTTVADNGDMARFIGRWFSLAIAVAIVVTIIPGFGVVGDKIWAIVAFSLFMALINAWVKPIVHLLALPLTILSLGLFSLVLTVAFMNLASWLALSVFGVGITISSFWWSVIASAIIAFISGIINSIVGSD
jgi:putative membrane protein